MRNRLLSKADAETLGENVWPRMLAKMEADAGIADELAEPGELEAPLHPEDMRPLDDIAYGGSIDAYLAQNAPQHASYAIAEFADAFASVWLMLSRERPKAADRLRKAMSAL